MELIRKKYARYFRGLDADDNGVLQADDLAATATRFCARLGYEEGSPQAVDLRESCLALWHHVIAPMDGDGDGQVTSEELIAAFLGQLAADPDGFDAAIRGIATRFFTLCDRDDDGWISQDEWVALFSSTALVPEQECRRAFAAVDSDGSGRVSLEEFQRASREFFSGADPDAPGNLMFGSG
ncbi:EF-hand domain-containing protein [Saccharothrix xinjiangensis]|uniref:EF-hand domain-containing protein n=1 Tax=Saccharothrix xinjiangensis TaxID=204798 RepID=A0ABV9Y2S9_9PSEU